MSIVTLEGVVGGGQIRLPTNVRLPDRTKVYIVVPSLEGESMGRLAGPRLAHPEQASDFKMEIVEEDPDAGL